MLILKAIHVVGLMVPMVLAVNPFCGSGVVPATANWQKAINMIDTNGDVQGGTMLRVGDCIAEVKALFAGTAGPCPASNSKTQAQSIPGDGSSGEGWVNNSGLYVTK